MKHVYFLNGISDSIATTTGLLVPDFRRAGFVTQHLYRPTTHFWRSRRKSYLRRRARNLLRALPKEKGGTIIAHSQGCLQTYYMMLEHAKQSPDPLFDNIVFIAPAMNRKGWDWNRLEFGRMLVIYNAGDWAIWAGSMLLFHPFGMAGVRGFDTDDIRIEQREDSTLASGFWGHNYFRGGAARDVVDLVEKFLK